MNFLRRFWNWLLKEDNELKPGVYDGLVVFPTSPRRKEPPTPQPTIQQKPRKAVYQNYGRFFQGKGARPSRAYRRSVKAKIQSED